MEFEAISTARMIALMVAGGLFAFAGLYMMLRPRSEGAAKIELFGLKFESSSAGLLVFIVGAAFLAVTLFVPEKPGDDGSLALPITPDAPTPVDPQQTPGTTINAGVSEGSGALPQGAVVEEVEGNDSALEANVITIGQRVTGTYNQENADWFALRTPADGFAGHEVMLRHVAGIGNARVDIYNVRQEFMGYVETSNGANYLPIKSEFPDWIYLKANQRVYGSITYELAVLPSK